MKRFLALTTALILAFVMAGCGSDSEPVEQTRKTTTTTTVSENYYTSTVKNKASNRIDLSGAYAINITRQKIHRTNCEHLALTYEDEVDFLSADEIDWSEVGSYEICSACEPELPAAAKTAESTTTNSKSKGATDLGKRNALSKALDYLNVMAFSYTGLIEQLEYEGFTQEEAVYGANNCGADWYEQAAKKAQSYIDIMAFSREGLIDQLIFDGFTPDEAEYGATAVGY